MGYKDGGHGIGKKFDKSVFDVTQEPPKKDRELMAKLEHDTQLAVASLLRKERIDASYTVETKGKEIVVRVAGVANDLMYRVSSLIMRVLEELKAAIFGAKRFEHHHAIVVNDRRLAYSS